MLVLGFFEYFARQFQWNQHVVSVTSSGPVHKVCDFASVPHLFFRTRSACLLSRLRCMPWCPPAVGSWTRSRTHKKTCIDAFVVCAGVQADVSFHQGQNTCICIQDPLDLVRLRALYACVAHALCAAAVSLTTTDALVHALSSNSMTTAQGASGKTHSCACSKNLSARFRSTTTRCCKRRAQARHARAAASSSLTRAASGSSMLRKGS